MYNYQNTGGIAPPPEMHIEAANQMAESIINDFPFDQQAAMVKHIAHRVKEHLENLIETKGKEIEHLKKCSSDLPPLCCDRLDNGRSISREPQTQRRVLSHEG